MTQFKRGDAVQAKDKARHPYWFTVVSATKTHAYCKFGAAGEYAGAFRYDELVPYSGVIKK